MAKASTLAQATAVLHPRPLYFSDPHPPGEKAASDPAFYAPLPDNKGRDGFKLPAPIERIKKRLLSGTRETKLFLSGHVGSGKSTELSRLRIDPEIQKRMGDVLAARGRPEE